MDYLIDGNNLLYAAHAYLPGPPIGRQQLCELLGRWGRRAATGLIVVFDGPRPPPGLEEQMRAANLAVVFSAPRSADEVIEEMIERASRPAQLHVITSDRAIQSAARYRRCPCTASADFARELATPAATTPSEAPPPSPPTEKPDRLLPEETNAWLREFDFDPDQPPDPTDLMRER
ncbi:MAG: NYN domain-containing protein [Planctomycetota bacterium]